MGKWDGGQDTLALHRIQSGGMKLFSTFIAATTSGGTTENSNRQRQHLQSDGRQAQIVRLLTSRLLADVASAAANVAAVATAEAV